MRSLTRIALVAVGSLSAALGLIGIFVPLLPTTPLLLLAAACYSRSSEKFYNRLLNSRCCGRYISNYREGRGIPLWQKVLTITLLWVTIGLTAWLAVSGLWIRLVLLAVAVGVTVHVATLRTLKR